MGLIRTIFYCLKLRRNDKLSSHQISDLRQAQLKDLVRYAKDHSPFYSELYRDVDPDSSDFSLTQLPTTTKSMLMDRFDEVVTDPHLRLDEVRRWARSAERVGQWYKGRFVVTTTSGTTGSPGYFVYDRRDWDWIQAFSVTRGVRFKPSFFQFFRYAGRILFKKVRVALISVLSGHFITYVLFKLIPPLHRLVSRFHFLSVTEPVDVLVEKLNRIKPNVLHCYPTMLEVLAHEQLAGRLAIEPWVITCSSEPLTDPARDVIQKAFSASQLFETYGTSEGVNLASECARHDGLHINSDYFILEPVMEDGSPARAGVPADKMFLTCLFARTMPIVRYEISDVTTSIAEPCGCGLPFPLLKVQGRTDDTFWVEDNQGQAIALPPIPFEALFLNVDGLIQYQLVQETAELLRIRFRCERSCSAQEVSAELLRRFEEYLGGKGLAQLLKLEIEQVEEIPRDPKSGKIRQIYSLVERPFLPGQPLGERRTATDRRAREEGVAEDRRQVERRGGADPDSNPAVADEPRKEE